MAKVKLSLQHSEGVVVQSAANIYAAYITAGRVAEGHEPQWMERSVHEAILIAKMTDDAVQSDSEMS